MMKDLLTPRIPSSPLLSLKHLIDALCNRELHYVFLKDVKLVSHTRSAITIWVQEHLKRQDRIYIPSYICSDVTEPLEAIGQFISYYPCQQNLEPDWTWLEENVSDDSKALLLVHYFGFPNNLTDALKFSNRHNLFLLEDCAHSFLTNIDGSNIGTFGTAGFYSYHKLLPIPNGAGIYDTQTVIANIEKYFHSKASRNIIEWTKLITIWVIHKLYLTSLTWRFITTSYHKVIQPNPIIKPSAMSRLSQKVMRSSQKNFQKIIEYRRRNYSVLSKELETLENLTVLFPNLEEGVCPYALPILVGTPDSYIAFLNKKGITAQKWPELPPDVVKNAMFSTSIAYSSKLILLPVHQNLSIKSIYKIADAMKLAHTIADHF